MMEMKRRKELVRQLMEWQQGQDHFTAQLFGLIAKADFFNKTRIAVAFPEEVAIYMAWYQAPNEESFFKDEEFQSL